MYGSPAMSKDLNLPFPGSPFNLGKEEADLHHPHSYQQHQMGSGLLRYRSMPSTVFGDVNEEFLPPRKSSPEAESMFARLLGPDLRGHTREKQQQQQHKATTAAAATEVSVPPQSAGLPSSASPQIFFQLSQQQQRQPNLSSAVSPSTGTGEGPFRVISSMGMDQELEKNGSGNSSLIQHSSSPAGLFSHLNADNGFASLRGMEGGFRPSGDSGRMRGQISFSSRRGSHMCRISEIGNETGTSPEDGGARSFIPGFPVASWDDSANISDSFSKRIGDPSEAAAQNGHVSSFNHQFSSLTKISPEMVPMERFLQFQDAVPCKIRAKRGCATHPRSIAERVRRTRISERMRKLQELVPNMDKQMNTADMLDLAVEYIKDLQIQAKRVSETRASCTCSSSKQKP